MNITLKDLSVMIDNPQRTISLEAIKKLIAEQKILVSDFYFNFKDEDKMHIPTLESILAPKGITIDQFNNTEIPGVNSNLKERKTIYDEIEIWKGKTFFEEEGTPAFKSIIDFMYNLELNKIKEKNEFGKKFEDEQKNFIERLFDKISLDSFPKINFFADMNDTEKLNYMSNLSR